MNRKPSFLFVAWTHVGGRSAEIAADLGGVAFNAWVPWLARGWRVPIRYAVSAVMTALVLIRHRPRAVMVTNPPIFPALVVWLWCALTNARFVLDSHPASFGLKSNRIAEFFLPVHRFLARRAAGVAVTTDELGQVVHAWGADPLIVHEAPPPTIEVADPVPVDGRPRVLFVCTFAPDEPWREVLASGSLLGADTRLLVTGRPERVEDALGSTLPGNVELVGFLSTQHYLSLASACDVVISLTTEPDSVMRSAYEAVYLSRPLIVSDTPALREVFPFARHTHNDASAVADAVHDVLAHIEDYRARAAEALHRQQDRWDTQRGELLRRLDLAGDGSCCARGVNS